MSRLAKEEGERGREGEREGGREIAGEGRKGRETYQRRERSNEHVTQLNKNARFVLIYHFLSYILFCFIITCI